MKKTLIFVLAAVAVLSFSSCNGLKKMIENADDINYSVNPQVLEMHAGQVAVSINGNFPEKYFNKKVTATITPTLVWEGGEKALTPVYIQGEKIEGNAKVIEYKTGGSFSYNEKFDYQPEMRRSHLELRITATKGSKTGDFEPELIAEGIIATPALVKMVGASSMAKDKFVKDIPESKMGQINYDKNRADLKASETKREEMVAIKNYILAADSNDRKQFVNVELISYASPEGTLEQNTKVSGDRSKTIDKYVKNEFKKIDEFKAESFFKYLVTEEDWEGFKKAVQESNIADKDMIIRVVNMNSDPVKREEEIRNMKATFDELEKVIHPMLRRSEVKVNIMNIGNTDEEIEALFTSNPEKLTVEEYLYLGNFSKTDDKKLAVYTKAAELYSTDWRCFNNLAAVQYRMGDYAAAKTSIQKAKSIEANATVLNNLGNVYLTEGNIKEAETNFKSATGVPEASMGQGVIAIKNGQYKNAVEFYGTNSCFNAGLAKVLNGDYDGAVKAADGGMDKDDAMNYYLKAIAGARKNDTEVLFNNLRTACSKDAKLKEFAAKDMEFFKYFENDTFKSIVK
jgi:tetratricopeptide (TPR) repeat protein